MARKIKAQALVQAAIVPDANGVLVGSNDATTPDVLVGDDGHNILDGLQGEDILTGGAGSDTFKVHSWASSNVGVPGIGRDTITDFEASDKIDLANIRFYSGVDHMEVRSLSFADITFEAIAGGNIIRAPVWEGDTRWDVEMVVLGETPTADNFIFA